MNSSKKVVPLIPIHRKSSTERGQEAYTAYKRFIREVSKNNEGVAPEPELLTSNEKSFNDFVDNISSRNDTDS